MIANIRFWFWGLKGLGRNWISDLGGKRRVKKEERLQAVGCLLEQLDADH